MNSKRKSLLCNADKVLTLCIQRKVKGRVHCVMQLSFDTLHTMKRKNKSFCVMQFRFS